jgi:hypothetical protein
MPRRCTLCEHPERHSIDETLVTGAPYRSVAKRFRLSESAVYRHKTEHLPAYLLKAREIEEAARADNLLAQVRHLQTHALDILERAEKAGDSRTALAAPCSPPWPRVRGSSSAAGSFWSACGEMIISAATTWWTST